MLPELTDLPGQSRRGGVSISFTGTGGKLDMGLFVLLWAAVLTISVLKIPVKMVDPAHTASLRGG